MTEPEAGITCESIEELVVKKSLSPLDGGEERQLQEHLDRCERCRAYQQVVERFHPVLANTQHDHQPDPAVHRRLRAQLHRRRPVNPVLRLLRKRVPVYQAVLSVAAVLVAFVSVNNLTKTSQDRISDGSQRPQSEYIPVSSKEAIENLKRIEKSGRNQAEDSLLVDLLESSMLVHRDG